MLMSKYLYVVILSILVIIISVGFYILNPIKNISENKNSVVSDTPKNNLIGKNFVWLKSEVSINGEVITPVKKDKYSIIFLEGNKVQILTDCNSGFGEYEIKNDQITFGNINSAEKYCPDSQEGIFYNELISAQSYSLDNDGNLKINIKIGTLYLKEANSSGQVNGAETSFNPLIGKEYRWLRTELQDNQVILPKIQGKFSLVFYEDQKFSVQTDCNSNGGNYSLDENKISLTDIVSTKMYCENSQENIFVRDLQKTSSFEILPDNTLILNLANNLGRIYFR